MWLSLFVQFKASLNLDLFDNSFLPMCDKSPANNFYDYMLYNVNDIYHRLHESYLGLKYF